MTADVASYANMPEAWSDRVNVYSYILKVIKINEKDE